MLTDRVEQLDETEGEKRTRPRVASFSDVVFSTSGSENAQVERNPSSTSEFTLQRNRAPHEFSFIEGHSQTLMTASQESKRDRTFSIYHATHNKKPKYSSRKRLPSFFPISQYNNKIQKVSKESHSNDNFQNKSILNNFDDVSTKLKDDTNSTTLEDDRTDRNSMSQEGTNSFDYSMTETNHTSYVDIPSLLASPNPSKNLTDRSSSSPHHTPSTPSPPTPHPPPSSTECGFSSKGLWSSVDGKKKLSVKILGGREAEKGQWPWQVAVLNRYKVSNFIYPGVY